MRLDPLRERLSHVYWLGGGSGAGKSTIAARLAAEHDLIIYSTDDAMTAHAQRCSPGECPLLEEFMRMNMDARWLDRSPEVMLQTFHWFKGEAFRFIVDDLVTRPVNQRILVEGFRLLPRLVAPLLRHASNAVWVLPTPSFRRHAFTSRGSLWTIAGKTSNPSQALDNLLQRDALFTERLRHEVAEVSGVSLEVYEGLTTDELALRVGSSLGLGRPTIEA